MHAIQQGKGRKATAEQRQHRAHEHRRALLDIDVLEFGDDIILHTRRDFMGQWSDSSFHGGPRKGTFWQAMKKAYSRLMILSNILFDLFKTLYDLLDCPWNCDTCVTSSPLPKNCISAVPRWPWASPSRP
ncbi:hypothetical protein EMIT043CA1_20257 [Pseudomonas brassicacearum]